MSFFTHFITFCFGIIFAIFSAVAVFYLVILQKIAKNELYLREMTAPRIIALFTRRVGDRPTEVVRERINEDDLLVVKEKEKEKKVEEKSEIKEQKVPETTTTSKTDLKGEMDPIALAIKNKQNDDVQGFPSLSQSISLSEQNVKILKTGWLKIRGSLNVWWNRWVVLRPGQLVYYRTEKKEDCFGLIILAGCDVAKKEYKKNWFTFRIYHPDSKNIYSPRGLKGESLVSTRFSGSVDECVIRVNDEQEGREWMQLIYSAIRMEAPPLTAATTVAEKSSSPRSGSLDKAPTSLSTDKLPSVKNSEEKMVRSPSKNKILYSSGDRSPDLVASPSDLKSSKEELTLISPETENIENSPRNNSPPKEETSISSTASEPFAPAKEMRDNASSFSSGDDEAPFVESKSESSMERSRSNSKSKTLEQVPSADKPDFKIEQISVEDKKMNEAEKRSISPTRSPIGSGDESSKGESTGPVVNERRMSVDRGFSLPESIPERERVSKEGWLELKTAKTWKQYYFVSRNGVLTYFDNEKIQDCTGIIDLLGCRFSIVETPTTIEISHPQQRQILLIMNAQKYDNSKQMTQQDPMESFTSIRIRCRSVDESLEWIQLLEEESHVSGNQPLVLPRIANMEGKEEKCHFLNLFIARYFLDIQNSEMFQALLWRSLSRKFARIKRPDYIGPVKLQEFRIGTDPFQIKELYMIRTQPGELIGEGDIVYRGGFSITISTEFYINWPSWHFAVIPIVATVKVEQILGRMMIYGPKEIFSRFAVSFVSLPECQFDVKLNVGGRQKNYDISKIHKVSDFIESMLKKLIYKNAVVPNRLTFFLPLPGRKLQLRSVTVTSKRSGQNPEAEAEGTASPK